MDSTILIGICDDNDYIHELIETLMELYKNECHIKYELKHYYRGSELLNASPELDCLLLDIDMPQMNGLDVAKKLRKMGVDYKIVMLTIREDLYKEAFKIQAFRFISKPISKNEFFSVLDDIRDHLIGRKCVKVHRDGIIYEIMEKDILFVEAGASASCLYTKRSEYRSDYSLKKWNEILDDRIFFQCHKSYLVNLGMIDRIEKQIVWLLSGDKIQVSRRLYQPLLKAYMAYDVKRR